MANFNLDQNEKNRILEMHKKATKNQYLSEQSFPNFGDFGDIMKQGFETLKTLGQEQIKNMITHPTVEKCFTDNDVQFPQACTTDPTSPDCIKAVQDATSKSAGLMSCLLEKSGSPIAKSN